MTASSASRSSASDRLGPNQAHLWLCSPDRAEALDTAVLSVDERERRHEAALGRVWLRHLLSLYADVAPADWQFETGEHGKPALVAGPGLQFNLSHSGQWLVVAVTADVPVGVDVQQLDRERRVERLARRYFSDPEVEALAELEGEAYFWHFYRLWTLKEAWTKAHGGALPTALGEVGYRLEGPELVCLAPGAMEGSSQWLADLGEHSLALCGLRRGLQIEAREWLGPAECGPLELSPVASTGVA